MIYLDQFNSKLLSFKNGILSYDSPKNIRSWEEKFSVTFTVDWNNVFINPEGKFLSKIDEKDIHAINRIYDRISEFGIEVKKLELGKNVSFLMSEKVKKEVNLFDKRFRNGNVDIFLTLDRQTYELYIYDLLFTNVFLMKNLKNMSTEIKKLTKRIGELEDQINYSPGGQGYLKAKEEFETLKENMK